MLIKKKRRMINNKIKRIIRKTNEIYIMMYKEWATILYIFIIHLSITFPLFLFKYAHGNAFNTYTRVLLWHYFLIPTYYYLFLRGVDIILHFKFVEFQLHHTWKNQYYMQLNSCKSDVPYLTKCHKFKFQIFTTPTILLLLLCVRYTQWPGNIGLIATILSKHSKQMSPYLWTRSLGNTCVATIIICRIVRLYQRTENNTNVYILQPDIINNINVLLYIYLRQATIYFFFS